MNVETHVPKEDVCYVRNQRVIIVSHVVMLTKNISSVFVIHLAQEDMLALSLIVKTIDIS